VRLSAQPDAAWPDATRPDVVRADEWHEVLGSAFAQLAPERLDDREPGGRLAGAQLGPLAAYQVAGTPQIVRRSTTAIHRAAADPLKICVQLAGRATVHQDGREIVLEPGQLAIYDTGRPYRLRLEHQWSCAVMAFPRAALDLRAPIIAAAMTHAYPLADGPGAVLASFVTAAVQQRAALYGTAACHLGEAGLHLVAGTLSAAAPPGSVAPGDPATAALRLRILDYVRGHLADPALSHASVAAAHHMSARTLHRMFEHEASTVTDYIRSRRLAAVLRDLTDPALANRGIAAIAARWCFTDQAHFTRSFRARYGISPSAARRELTAQPARPLAAERD
jgi:AraC-like DNA-binding protein